MPKMTCADKDRNDGLRHDDRITFGRKNRGKLFKEAFADSDYVAWSMRYLIPGHPLHKPWLEYCRCRHTRASASSGSSTAAGETISGELAVVDEITFVKEDVAALKAEIGSLKQQLDDQKKDMHDIVIRLGTRLAEVKIDIDGIEQQLSGK